MVRRRMTIRCRRQNQKLKFSYSMNFRVSGWHALKSSKHDSISVNNKKEAEVKTIQRWVRSKRVLDRIERFYLSNTMLERVLEIRSTLKKKEDKKEKEDRMS